MSVVGSTYEANQPYNNSDDFVPPNTILEPPDYNNGNGILRLRHKPFLLHNSAYGEPNFLRLLSSIPPPEVSFTASKYGWDYKKRHEAQAVLPFLYLGPFTAARNSDYLQKHGITMVVAVRSAQYALALPKGFNPAYFSACANLETATFDVDGPYDIITRIKPVLKIMTDHIQRRTGGNGVEKLPDVGGKILVFCETGNERSPVLVAAYIMLLYGVSWNESLNYIMAHRFSVCLPGGMLEMLKTWDGMLGAESAVAAMTYNTGTISISSSTYASGKSNKRSVDDAYDSDETMTDEKEVEVRPGIAPFR